MTAALRRSLSSLEVPNYRRFFAGQLVSASGNWTQVVAEMWLILALTGSGVAAGAVSALQFLPILLFGAWGGLLADRVSKRRLLVVTQALMALPALGLFAVTVSGIVVPWMVYALVFARGAVNAVDNPARQSFVIEIVGSDRVVNAVGLNSVLIHAARIAGPAIGGILILLWGVEPCFVVNAASFAAMVVALRRMNPDELHPAPPAERDAGAFRAVAAGISYARHTPGLAIPLAMMAVVGTLGFNFQVILPLLARFAFDGGAGAYTSLVAAMGIGSVAGALITGARSQIGPRMLTGAALGFGAVALVAAAAPSLALVAIMLVPLGAASVMFAASVSSTLQLSAAPEMRGRVMALYSIVFLGSAPIGGPLVGWLAEVAGPRTGLLLAGVAGLATAAGSRVAFARLRDHAANGDETTDPTRPCAAIRARECDRDHGDHGRVRRKAGARPRREPTRHADDAAGGDRVRHHRDVGGRAASPGPEVVSGPRNDRVAG